MIKQDYLIRMIQEIVALLVNALLRRKRIRQEDWSEYDAMASQLLGLPLSQLQTVDVDELADRYAGEESGIEKMELASLYLLRLSEETEGSIVFKSKLRQDGLRLGTCVQQYLLFATGNADPHAGSWRIKNPAC